MFKLQYKIALLQFAVGCAIILFGLTAHQQYFIKARHQGAQNSLERLSQKIAQQVDLLLQEKADKIKALTGAPVIENLLLQSNAKYSTLTTEQINQQIARKDQQWRETEDIKSPFIQAFLSNSVAKYFHKQFEINPEEYGEIFLTNRYGALVASTGKLTTFAHGHKYWWTASYNGGKGKTFFDDRGFDASVKGYVLGIVVPVKKDGQIIGILKSNIRIQRILDKIVSCSSAKNCEVSIVRDNGAIVLQPGHAPLSTRIRPEIQTKVDEQQGGSVALEGLVPTFAGFTSVMTSRGSDQFAFGGNPKSIDHIHGNQGEGWNVVVTDNQADALQLSRRGSLYFYGMNALVVFVLAFIALYIGRRIATPLKALTAAAKTIGGGDFNIKLNVSSTDELGAVAKAFNDMSANLSTTMATKEEYSLEIEQRKQTENALRISEKELKEAQRLSKLGSWDLDLTNNSLSWSDEVYRIFDLDPQQLPATYEGFIDNIHPDDRDYVNKAYTESVENRQPYNIIHRLLRADGTLKYVNERCETYFDDDGNPVRSVGTVQDISESIVAEQQRKNLEGQLHLKHKMEAVGHMAGGMAHNFNNNLSIILGNIELTQMKQQTGSEVIPFLKNAKIAVERSRDLVQSIITYSRKGIQEKKPIRLTSIIDETVTLLQSTLPSTINLQTRYKPDCDNRYISADPSQIQEVLINLCNNAIQAMDEKGNLVISQEPVDLTQVEISAQYDCLPGQYAKLSVQDTGCGMPEEMLDKIFDPFYTTKEEYEGAGIGLSTVHGIVTQHGGMIKVSTTLNQGTTFELYFPRTVEESHKNKTTTQNNDLPRGTEQILYVDDDKVLAKLGELMLTEMGYQVTIMTDSTEALNLFSRNADHFDLVITDQTMPGLTGKELIQELKKIRADIPTIICTGFSSKVDEDSAKELGANAFLMKPFDMPKLMQTVRQVLDEKPG